MVSVTGKNGAGSGGPSPSDPQLQDAESLSPEELADAVAELMLEKHALEVTIMDLRGITSMTDEFVLGTGASAVQVKAIVDHIDDTLRKRGLKPYHIEGYEGLAWVVLDYMYLVVHVFLPTQREYYGLERLWADAKIAVLEDEAP